MSVDKNTDEMVYPLFSVIFNITLKLIKEFFQSVCRIVLEQDGLALSEAESICRGLGSRYPLLTLL